MICLLPLVFYCRRISYVKIRIFARNTIFRRTFADGGIRFIKGALAIAYDAAKLNKKRIIVPKANAHEAALISGLEVIGVDHITELIAYLRG